MLNNVTTVIAILALVLGGVAVFSDGTPVPPEYLPVGGTVGYQKQSFLEGFYAGTSRQVEVTRTGAVTIGTASATSSVNFGRACWTVTANDGDTVYVFFDANGSLATSSSSCL